MQNHTHTGASHRHLAYVEGGINETTVGSTQGVNASANSALAHYTEYVTPGAGSAPNNNTTATQSASHTHSLSSHTHAVSGTTNAGTGSGAKHTTPIMCVNFIIKT